MKIAQILQIRQAGDNIAAHLSDDQLSKIGHDVVEAYKTDLGSRAEWEKRYKEANNLALQVVEKKNMPWEGAAAIKFPLLTIACIQFSARVYAQLINGTNIVKMRTVGTDETGEKLARAKRVETHMSYQVLEEDVDWEEEMDRTLMALPLVGTVFKKSFYDPIRDLITAQMVLPKDLIVNYYAKSLESATTLTHRLFKAPNLLEEHFRLGIYRTVELTGAIHHQDIISQAEDKTVGFTKPQQRDTDPYEILEQHTYLDLDDDGYQEPYIVTVLSDTSEVLRITPRFRDDDIIRDGDKVLKINPRHHFTKFPFIPSPDGSFYDLGFGGLLGPLNQSVNTLLNQLIDAGTLANRQGGFLGRGARLKGGRLKFKIGEWQTVNASGDDLRKSIVPLPIREPSSVLFQLLSFLVDYGERLSSVSDMMVGKTPGQNTPATTAMAALEEGMRVFTSIYKRIYRSMKHEFKIRYRLNQEYLDPKQYYTILDTGDRGEVFQQDYLGDPSDIRPAADPNVVSDAQRMQRAEALSQRAASVPGYNTPAVERRLLASMHIEGIQEVFPTDDEGNLMIQPPPDPKTELEKMTFQRDTEFQATELRLRAQMQVVEMDKIIADTMLSLAKAEAAEEGTQLDYYRSQLETIQAQREAAQSFLDQAKQNEQARQGGLPAMGGQPNNPQSNAVL